MKIAGIICEYNPLHLGHLHQLDTARRLLGPECGIVCLMSGSFVQRGAPAILDPSLRARAALVCGADLVLELPVTASLSSAEGFAHRGVEILSPFCTHLCFGAESPDAQALNRTAHALLTPEFSNRLGCFLETGLSFPAARQAALEAMGLEGSLLASPNNILAVEYCKAMLRLSGSMQPLPILRAGSYHASLAHPEFPSATALRGLMEAGQDWQRYVPAAAAPILASGTLHTLAQGERAMLAVLRTMSDADFEALPYGSEGLWRKFMHSCRRCASLEEILTATKSKRYTRSRLDRMAMCAFLRLTRQDLEQAAPYTRVLALNDRGRQILKTARQTGSFLNAGEKSPLPWQQLEQRCGALYGLFARPGPEPPQAEASRRVIYIPGAGENAASASTGTGF